MVEYTVEVEIRSLVEIYRSVALEASEEGTHESDQKLTSCGLAAVGVR